MQSQYRSDSGSEIPSPEPMLEGGGDELVKGRSDGGRAIGQGGRYPNGGQGQLAIGSPEFPLEVIEEVAQICEIASSHPPDGSDCTVPQRPKMRPG